MNNSRRVKEAEYMKFRSLLESSHDIIARFDRNYRYLYVNKAVSRYFPFSQEDFIGKTHSELGFPEDKANILEKAFRKVFETGEPQSLELGIDTDRGSYYFDWRICPEFDNGKIEAIMTVSREITERRNAEEKQERINHWNKLILNSAGEGILGLNSQDRHTFVNPAAARMLGYSVDELLDRHSHLTWHHTKTDGSPYPLEECPICGSYNKGVVYECVRDEVFWRKDGTSFPVSYTSAPIIENGDVTGAVVTFLDFTECKKAEDELKISEENFRRLMDRNPVAMAVADKSGKFIYFNSRFIGTFGYTLEDMPTVDDWWPLAYPDEEYRHKVISSWRAAAMKAIENRNQTENQEWRVRCKDGSSRDIEFRMASLQDVNIVIFNDITERKRSEEAIRKTHQALEKAYTDLKAAQSQILHNEKMASIGQLAAGIAHEIKNPLGIIVQGMDFLKGSLSDSLLADASERIKKAALRADMIVRDLLSFARQSPPALEKMDIVSIIEETLSLVEHQLHLKNIRIIRRFQEGTLTALADTNQMKQVFINLLLNATDAMRQGGTIKIDAGMIVTPAGKPAVHISFSDNGCGIPPENLRRYSSRFLPQKGIRAGQGWDSRYHTG